MANLKEKLEEAAFELGRVKFELYEAQKRFDALYKRIAEGGKMHQTTPPIGKKKNAEERTTRQAFNSSMTVSDRIEVILNSDPKKKWDYSQISAMLPGVARNTIRALLFNLRKEGKAFKVGRGQWKSPKPIHSDLADGKHEVKSMSAA